MKQSFQTSERDASEAAASTAERILAAALRVLARDGFGALSARSIAAEAGTNLALLNYYFGSKELLLLAIFDRLDAERIERQRQMYATPGEPLSAKWRRAVDFYRQDLADGYVRMLQELTAHGYSNPVVGERVRQRLNAWRTLLEDAAAEALPALGIELPPAWVGSAVASFWLGMETQHLVGASEEEGSFFAILDAVGDWLERREAEVGQPSAEHTPNGLAVPAGVEDGDQVNQEGDDARALPR